MIDLFDLIENNDSSNTKEKLKICMIHIKGEVNSRDESDTRHLFDICDILLNNKTEVDVQIMNVTSSVNSEDLTIRDRVAMRVNAGTTYTYEIVALMTLDVFNLIDNEHSAFVLLNSVCHETAETTRRSLFDSTFDFANNTSHTFSFTNNFDYSLLDEGPSLLSDFASWRVRDDNLQPSLSLSLEALGTPLEPNISLDAIYATRNYVEDLFENSTYSNIPRYRMILDESTGNCTLIEDNDGDGDRP